MSGANAFNITFGNLDEMPELEEVNPSPVLGASPKAKVPKAAAKKATPKVTPPTSSQAKQSASAKKSPKPQAKSEIEKLVEVVSQLVAASAKQAKPAPPAAKPAKQAVLAAPEAKAPAPVPAPAPVHAEGPHEVAMVPLPPKVHTLAQALARIIMEYEVVVSSEVAPRVREALGVNAKIREVGAAGTNPHELLAAVRQLATLWGFCKLLEHGYREIDSRFGNDRDLVIANHINVRLATMGFGSASEPYLTVHICDNFIVPADHHRREHPEEPSVRRQAAFYMDVYAHGGTPGNPVSMNPRTICNQGYDMVYWIGHPFHDFWGAIDTAVWCRSAEPEHLVSWTSDLVSPPYPSHDPCDAMHVAGAGYGYSWEIAHSWQITEDNRRTCCYDAVRFTRSELVLAPLAARTGGVGALTITVPDWNVVSQYFSDKGLGTIGDLLSTVWGVGGHPFAPKKRVMLQRDHLTRAYSFLAGRGRSRWVFSGLQTFVMDMLRGDKVFQRVLAAFPDRFARYQTDLITATMSRFADRDAQDMRALRSTHAAHFAIYNDAARNLDVPDENSPNRNMVFVWLGLAVVTASLSIYASRTKVGRLLIRSPLSVVDEKLFSDVRAKTHSVIDRTLTGVQNVTKGLSRALSTGIRTRAHSVVDRMSNRAESIAKERFSGRVIDYLRRNGRQIILDLAVSPLVEEIVKKQMGVFRGSATVAIGDTIRACAGSPELVRYSPLVYIVSLCLHSIFAMFPFPVAVAVHSFWNMRSHYLRSVEAPLHPLQPLICSGVGALVKTLGVWTPFVVGGLMSKPAQNHNAVDDFDRHCFGPDPIPVTGDEVKIVPMRPDQIYVSPSSVTVREPKPIDPLIKCSPPLSSVPDGDEGIPTSGYWRIFGVNTPMYKPDNSARNAHFLVTHRLMREISNKVTDHRWLIAMKFFVHDLTKYSTEPESPNNICQHMFSRLGRTELTEDHLLLYIIGGADFLFDIFEVRRRLYALLPDLDLPDVNTPEGIKWWLAHTDPAKARRYLSALELVERNPLNAQSKKVTSVQVNIKCDEVLLKWDWIPRPIDAVDPTVAVTVGPSVYRATEVLKKLLFCRPVGSFGPINQPGYSYEKSPIYMTFGAGLSAEQLSEWFKFATEVIGVHVIVAGDDSLVIFHVNGTQSGCPYRYMESYEADISQNDHSTRISSLASEMVILNVLGVPPELLEILIRNSRAPRVVGFRARDRPSVVIHRSHERNTGGVDTTFGNTWSSMLSWYYTLKAWGEKSEYISSEAAGEFIQDRFLDMGFSLKIRLSGFGRSDVVGYGYGVFPGSFLKGTWYLSVDGRWVWGPLLSRMIKISKTMTNPTRTHRVPGQPKPTMDQALRAQMVSVAKSMLSFPMVEPLRLFFQRQVDEHPSSSTIKPAGEEFADPWKPRGFSGAVPRLRSSILQLSDWYDTAPEEMEDFLHHVSSLKVGDFSFHPVWAKLAHRDYA